MKRYILTSLLAFLMAGCGGGETSVSKDTQVEIDRKPQATIPEAKPLTKTTIESRVQDDVQQSKRFFNELRAQAMSLTDYQHSGNPGFLDTESQNIGIELNKIATMGQSVSLWLATLYKDIESMEIKGVDSLKKDNYVVQRTAEGSYSYSIALDTWKGILSVPNIEKVSLLGTDTIHVVASGTFPKQMDKIAELTTTENSQKFDLKADITKPTDANASIKLQANVEDNGTTLMLNDLDVDVNYDIEKSDENQNFKNIGVKVNKLLVVAITPAYKMSGNLSLEEYVTNKTLTQNRGSMPSKLKFRGGVTNIATKGDISGNIDVTLKNAKDINLTDVKVQDLDLKVDMSATIKMPNRPAMTSSVNYDTDNMSYSDHYKLNFYYNYDKTAISGIASFDKSRKYGTINLSSGSGVAMKVVIIAGKVAYGNRSQVTRNGKVIGELQERENVPVIKYIDGSFESLP
jgi:hypothetical protein